MIKTSQDPNGTESKTKKKQQRKKEREEIEPKSPRNRPQGRGLRTLQPGDLRFQMREKVAAFKEAGLLRPDERSNAAKS